LPSQHIDFYRVLKSWAEFAAVFLTTRPAFLAHEKAKTELKGLMPDDAKEAFGQGIRAKRSKSGCGQLRSAG
jgi:hypothetical protein